MKQPLSGWERETDMDFNGLQNGLAIGAAYEDLLDHREKRLSEAEKEDLILRCKDAASKSEFDRAMDTVRDADEDSDEFLNALPKGPSIG